MAAHLGVSLATVREAIGQLKAERVVDARPGSGTYAARRTPAARIVRATRRRASRQEAADIRRMVEPALARAAARRATAGHLEELFSAFLERSHSARYGEPDEFIRADLALHLAVTRAAGNGIGLGLHRLTATLLGSCLAADARRLAASEELEALHRELVDAIADGRERRAERVARAIASLETQAP